VVSLSLQCYQNSEKGWCIFLFIYSNRIHLEIPELANKNQLEYHASIMGNGNPEEDREWFFAISAHSSSAHSVVTAAGQTAQRYPGPLFRQKGPLQLMGASFPSPCAASAL
jgi:hypothetical protein